MDGNGKLVRVFTQYEVEGADYADFWLPNNANKPYIRFSGNYGRAIDIVGHEFTHGVTYYTAELPGTFEGGALNESYSDFFGTLIERRSSGGVMDWSYGNNPANLTLTFRRLDRPDLANFYVDNSSCSLEPGQPTTYMGDRWDDGTCTNFGDGGAYSNMGVQNFLFYLLAEGGTGTNDNMDNYTVTGIGIDNTAQIAYRALTTKLTSASGFAQSRTAMITSAEELFGVCSPEAIQTANAWYAVGVGNPSICPTSVKDQLAIGKIQASVFPNPTSGTFQVKFPDEKDRTLKLFTIMGEKIAEKHLKHRKICELDLTMYPPGMYFVEISNSSGYYSLKVVKQ